MGHFARLRKAMRLMLNADLTYNLWAFGPHRDLRHLAANCYGGRNCLKLATELSEQLDRGALLELARAFPHRKGDPASAKYLCTAAHLVRAAWITEILGLHHVDGSLSRPLRVLDIGTGAGYFPFAVNHLGHAVTCIDLDDNELYNHLAKAFKLNRVIHRVTLENPLPPFSTRFDFITAFQLLFDRDESKPGGTWQLPDWEIFLDHLKENYLEPNGQVFIGLNSGLDPYLRSELEAFFSAKRGRAFENGYLMTNL